MLLLALWLVGCADQSDTSSPKDSADTADSSGVDTVDSTGDSAGDDADGDGYSGTVDDCDDGDASIHPGATEVCDDVDNNCDGEIDEGVTLAWYYDGDGDGYGDDAATTDACTQPAGYVDQAGDCDDADPAYHPGATESDCEDPNDYNCDGSVGYTDADGDGAAACADCDDGNADAYPGAVEVCDGVDDDCDGDVDEDVTTAWYADADGDGFGDPGSVPTEACTAPAGTVDNADDCDDADAAVSPDATETCNGIDDNCNDLADDEDPGLDLSTASPFFADTDGDTYGAGAPTPACVAPEGTSATGGDCDDTDATAYPGAPEVCDGGVDNNCNGVADDDDPGTTDLITTFTDADADGYGIGAPTRTCTPADGAATVSGDCDDTDATINPDGAEVCNGKDDDCDTLFDTSDPDITGTTTSYTDVDGDGWGDDTTAATACLIPEGSVGRGGDCDDTSASISPSASETCNGVDDNCNGLVDSDDGGVTDATSWFTDGDGDGYGSGAPTRACTAPSGTTATAGDCDDTTAARNPAATETCDGIDDDCDSLVDDADPSVAGRSAWFTDGDGDGVGGGAPTLACTAPADTVGLGSDCDDTDASVFPGATETCNGIDDDCDSLVDDADTAVTGRTTWFTDSDADGYGAGAPGGAACTVPDGAATTGGDCDDANADAHPGATEVCNGFDDNCNGTADDADAGTSGRPPYYTDGDADGYGSGAPGGFACTAPAGSSATGGDCNDGDADVSPGADERCDGYDDDCDGLVDDADSGVTDPLAWYPDLDGDSFGAGTAVYACVAPADHVASSTDCDDDHVSTYPGAPEICGNGIDENCDGADARCSAS